MINKNEIKDNPMQIRTTEVSGELEQRIQDVLGVFEGIPEQFIPSNYCIICDTWDFLSEEEQNALKEQEHPFYLAWKELSE